MGWQVPQRVGFSDFTSDPMDEKEAIKMIVEKLIASFGITDPVHISHISGYKTANMIPVFEELESENKISKIPYKIGRKQYYIHTSKMHLLSTKEPCVSSEVRLISPMDTIVRDKAWLETFFDYSFTFEYFKKKGMKWPLSILVGNRFVGYIDCKMDWRTQKFIIKERNLFCSEFDGHKGIELAIQDLAAFHNAKEIVEQQEKLKKAAAFPHETGFRPYHPRKHWHPAHGKLEVIKFLDKEKNFTMNVSHPPKSLLSSLLPPRSPEELTALVEKIGFLPFFRGSIEGFSLEELCPPSLWFAEGVDGPWEWKGPVARSGRCVYGKFFGGKAGFVSLSWFPDFANFRRDGYDFDARFDDGLASFREKGLYDAVAEAGAILSGDLKELCNYRKGGNKGLDSIITRLQMQTYLCIGDFPYKKDKTGKPYGWGVAKYTTPEALLGENAVRAAYLREPAESEGRILYHLRELLPHSQEAALRRWLRGV